ncbi:GNAT family N-acetyltransferase [Andreprevotia lacus]|jgi:RimJ/RimL family protein N-acetyltransferase|nr:GNAT family protein [Andreprevotia lacus]
MTQAHAAALAQAVLHPSLRAIPVGRMAHEYGAAALLVRQLLDAERQLGNWYAVLDGNGEFVGQVGLVVRRGAQAQLTYWIAAPARGMGHATAAARLAVQLAFAGPELQLLTTVVTPGNAPSLRVLQKTGFARAPALDKPGSHLGFCLQRLAKRREQNPA